MNIEEIREYCLSKKGVAESFPFEDTTLVFKVMNKMFCLASLENFGLNLKNNPEKNMELREQYQAVKQGYHMNKQHWNTIDVDGSIHPDLLKEWIDESYDLIVLGLPKKKQQELKDL